MSSAQRWTRVWVATLVVVASAAALASGQSARRDAGDRQPVRAGTDSGQKLRAPAVADEFSFVIFGDRTSGKPEGLRVLEAGVTATNRLGPAFAMTVGDMVQGYNDSRTWLRQMREYKGHMGKLDMPWFPVVGNHDVYDTPRTADGHLGLYKQHFGPLYYSFDFRWAHFVCLFSDEQLSFSNYARDQNMGQEQMRWLREDLAATDATQVYVFLHHPRWNYKGCNWDDVHRILAGDGRVVSVIAGHVHEYRDDGLRDGIHYYTMGVTGGARSGLTTSSFDHINLARVRRDDFTMCVLPVGAVLGSDVVLGAEVDEMHRLARGGWISQHGRVRIHPSLVQESRVDIVLENPTKRPLRFELEAVAPDGWTVTHEPLRGQLAAGQSHRVPIQVTVPGLTPGTKPEMQIRALMKYPLGSGIVQSMSTSLDVPLYVTGLPDRVGKRQSVNKVLSLNGTSALRLDISDAIRDLDTFTLECWVRGDNPGGRAGLATKTENSSFGLFWSDDGSLPTGLVKLEGKPYTKAVSTDPWAFHEWTHVALVYDRRSLRLFVGGRLAAQTAGAGDISINSFPLYVGADPDRNGNPNSFFRGEIDELHLTGSTKYRKPFTPNRFFRADRFSIVLLHLDTQINGIHPDDSGRENHAWAVGTPRLVPTE